MPSGPAPSDCFVAYEKGVLSTRDFGPALEGFCEKKGKIPDPLRVGPSMAARDPGRAARSAVATGL
ncbi:MAG: hypothetical protein CMN75_11705 [Spirochaeta sp.]|nr:hypothetical protein [Spirochaeta sp.]